MKFDKLISYSTYEEKTNTSIITHYNIHEITLHAVSNGNVTTSTISKEEFDKLMKQIEQG